MAAGNISAFLEQVDYHGRRLAKLDVPPNSVLESLKEYEEALAPDLKRFFPGNYGRYLAALDHLNFCIKLTLNSAYYQVRDSEAQAFYEVFQDQLQSLSVDDLMARVLATLMRTFRAQGGVILLLEEESRRLVAKAWNGMEESLAARFQRRCGPRACRQNRRQRQAASCHRRRRRAAGTLGPRFARRSAVFGECPSWWIARFEACFILGFHASTTACRAR